MPEELEKKDYTLEEDYNNTYKHNQKVEDNSDFEMIGLATLGYDQWQPKTDEDRRYKRHLGRVYKVNIEEGLSQPFFIQGEVAFFEKKPNMISKKMHMGLSVGKPNIDRKYWHGIINEWTYLGIKTPTKEEQYYVYGFSMIPEMQFKLGTKRNRIFYPSVDDAPVEQNQDIIFNKSKLMANIIERLIKKNNITLKDEKSKDRTSELVAIHGNYESQSDDYEIQIDEFEAKNDQHDNHYDKVIIDINMSILDAQYRMAAIENPRSKYLNYDDQTNFAKSEQEDFPEYIVQYEETDWELLNRLCRDFGVYYCFEHTDVHTGIVFYNNPQGADVSDSADANYDADDEEEEDDLAGFNSGDGAEIADESGSVSPSASSSPSPYKTYLGYENAIENYSPTGELASKGANAYTSVQSGEMSIFDDGFDTQIVAESQSKGKGAVEDGAVSKVFDMSDPFTDSRPLHYTTTGLEGRNDKYISQWNVAHKYAPNSTQLQGFNPDLDPEKRNIIHEVENSSGANSSESSASDVDDHYSETFTSDQKVKEYNGICNQHADTSETEYHTKTFRQEVSPGYKFVLTHHPDIEMNGQYYVKRVSHKLEYQAVDKNMDDATVDLDDMVLHYENSAVFSKIDQPFKVKPEPYRKIAGIQTGIVVGGEDQKIYTNHLGQVKVYFHWDNGRKNLSNGEMLQQAVWIRVAQWGGAGNEWGGFFVPRIGQEVVISFENGNPNYPIITGCLYNRTTMPPYNLVETEDVISKTGLKTESLKDVEEGEERGFNEFSFEDKANEEKIFLHAEKDYEEIIKDGKSSTIQTGSSELIIGRGDRKVELSGEDEPTDGEGNDILIIKKGNKEIKLESEEAKHFLTELKNGDMITKIEEGNYKLDLNKGNKEITLQDGNMNIEISKGNMEINLGNGNSKEEISGNKDITINSGNHTIKISGGNMEIEANQITYKASSNFTIKSGGNLTLEAGGNLNLKGGIVALKSDTTADIEASAMINIKAGMVNLN